MISVIVVLFYSKHLLEGLLNNLRDVIGSSLGEIILVNNSKQENLDDYKGERIKIINSEINLGYGAGMNLGVSLARCERLLLINPDLSLEKFEYVINPNIFFLAGGYNTAVPYGSIFPSILRDTLRITIKRIFPFKYLNFILNVPHTKIIQELQNVDYFSGSLLITNKKTFSSINGFDPNFFLFYEEIDLCKRAKNKGINIFITQEVKYVHAISSIASSTDVKRFRIECELFSFFKYHRRYSKRGLILTKYFIFIFSLIVYPLFYFLSLLLNTNYLNSRKTLFKIYLNTFFSKWKNL